MFFSKRIPKGKTKCASCNATGTETYYEDVWEGGASDRTRTQRQKLKRNCSICGGLGYL